MRMRAFVCCCLLVVYACGAKRIEREAMDPIPPIDVPLIYPPCCPEQKDGEPKCVQIYDTCWLIPAVITPPVAYNGPGAVTVTCSHLKGSRTLLK